jgi:hypothetical protein
MRLMFLILLAGLTGCAAVVPTVQYRELKSSDDMAGMADSFYLQASAIVVDVPRTGEVKIASVRQASGVKYGIKPIRTWRADTIVNLTKLANTDVVSAIGVDTKDRTVAAIGDYGGAVVKLVGLAAGLRDPQECSFPISVSVASRTADGRAVEEVSSDPGCVSVLLAPIPVDAAPRASVPVEVDTSNFYYAACRDATVTVAASATRSAVKQVRVADPRFVQFVQFPGKGSITAHSECGESVVTKDAGSDPGSAIAEALAAEGKGPSGTRSSRWSSRASRF